MFQIKLAESSRGRTPWEVSFSTAPKKMRPIHNSSRFGAATRNKHYTDRSGKINWRNTLGHSYILSAGYCMSNVFPTNRLLSFPLEYRMQDVQLTLLFSYQPVIHFKVCPACDDKMFLFIRQCFAPIYCCHTVSNIVHSKLS